MLFFQLTGAGVLVCTIEELQQLSHKMFLSSLSAQVCCINCLFGSINEKLINEINYEKWK